MEFFLYIGYQYPNLIQFVFLYIVPSLKKFQEVKEFYLKKVNVRNKRMES